MNRKYRDFEELYQNVPKFINVCELGTLICEFINKYGENNSIIKAFCITEELENGDKNILIDITNLQLREQYKIHFGDIIDGKEVLTKQYRRIEPVATIALNFGGNQAYNAFKTEMYEKAKLFYEYLKQSETEEEISAEEKII